MEERFCQNAVLSSDSVDKSRIVDVKPLRSLAPVLPKSIQASLSDRYPSQFPPFFLFEEPQEVPPSIRNLTSQESKVPPPIPNPISKKSKARRPIPNPTSKKSKAPSPIPSPTSPESKAPPPISNPTPIRIYRSPLVEEATPHGGKGDASPSMEGFNGYSTAAEQKCAASPLRGCKSSQKRSKKTQDSHDDPSYSDIISPALREDGDRETVNLVLMTYDSLRRRLCQLEDANALDTSKAIKRSDLRASNALTLKGFRTNMRKRVGVVPGVEIGDIFFFRMEMCLVGLHGQTMGGIDYTTIKDETREEPVALSIVSSGEYDDATEDENVLVYSGQGENFNKKDKHAIDQKLQRGNLALDRSSRRKNEVRVIRGLKDTVSKSSSAKIYVYDGLYKIQDSWIERGKSGGGVFKYKFVRLPGQPSAFSVWKSVQKFKAGFSSRNGLILADISTGVESIPISLVNDVDKEKGPAFFTYFHSLKHSKPFGSMQSLYHCNCNKACIPGDLNCSCIQKNGGDFPYTANGILVSRRQLVHECGPMCSCLPSCKNRVSQAGIKHPMEVFRTKDRGWGLRSLDPIRAGTFICEYAGEVIDRAKVSQNRVEDDDEYIFDTSRIYEPFKWNYEPTLLEEVSPKVFSEDYTIPSPLIISAKNVGNVARFMNHSCSPNVFWQPVVYPENNNLFLHIAFYARRHIPPMTELTYDYGISLSGQAEGSKAPKGRKKCLCGSPKCRGSFG